MTTINPVKISQTQAKIAKKQQKLLSTADKAFREIQLKELMKADPERVKCLILNETISKFSFKNILKFFKARI